MRVSRWLAAIWLCFVVRAFFYCAALPIWEGYDEWAHFAVVSRMAFRGEALVSRESPLPRDVDASLQLAPVSWECRYLHAPSLTHDDFWRLPVAERVRREAEFRAIPPGWAIKDGIGPLKAYEGLQGPLAGWLMAPVLLLMKGAHLATQVLVLRCYSMLLLSLVIPLAYLTARAVFQREGTALGCAAIVAAMPGLLIGIARVSNEAAAVLLFTALLWLCVGEPTARRLVAIGAVLGLGLLAKAYFLTALPPVGLLLVWRCRRVRALLAPGVALAISGWWYAYNLVTTSTLSGMAESVAIPKATFAGQVHQAMRVPWVATIDSILFSHLWLGAWSTLTVRSWMYHLFYLLIGLGAVGVVLGTWRARGNESREDSGAAWRSQVTLAGFLLVFWAGQLYHANLLSMVWGIATSLGVYCNAVLIAEVVLCVAGLRVLVPRAARGWVAAAGVSLMAVFDLYTLQMVALPYYTGFVAHRPGGGTVAAFHPATATLGEFLSRLTAFKAPVLIEPVMAALWVLYTAATVGVAVLAWAAARRAPACEGD